MLVSQLFIGLVFCLGILLALGRGERLSLTANLSRTQAASESQAEVLSTIIDSMHDGLTVIDETRAGAAAQPGRRRDGPHRARRA